MSADLDYSYIAELVDRAKNGDSDAFAELYATTYQKQYLFSYCYLKDEFLAQDALQETYVSALKNLSTLKDSKLFVSWLNQINFRVCYTLSARQKKYNFEMEGYANMAEDSAASQVSSPEDQIVTVDNKQYIIQQVMALPYSESQAILLHYYKNLKIDDIAFLMETSRSTVKRYLASGKKRLSRTLSS